MHKDIIYNLGVKNQRLIHNCLSLGLINEARKLRQIDRHLINLARTKTSNFDFVKQVSQGKTLLVGEGNLSFALSLAKKEQIKPKNIFASTFESKEGWAEETFNNAKRLVSFGASIYHSVDATKIESTFQHTNFDNIVFQFPNVASREPIEGHNPNFILIRDFLESAYNKLNLFGNVLISIVDSPYYNGIFNLEEAAEVTGFQLPDLHPFDPNDFPGYSHTMTHQEESALEKYDKFSTWVLNKTK